MVLAYIRGRHVQSNYDRRVVERAKRRFYVAQSIEFGKSITWKIHVFGPSGREMAVPLPVSVVATPPEIVSITVQDALVVVTNRNQQDTEVAISLAVQAGGMSESANFSCRPEIPVVMQLEELPPDPAITPGS